MEPSLATSILRYGPSNHQNMRRFYGTVLEREALNYEAFPFRSNTQYLDVFITLFNVYLAALALIGASARCLQGQVACGIR